MTRTSAGNLLASQTSPYLLQHAANPVDWRPWNNEALALARDQGKPILLSIGYSACHWCHVMAHESFENEATAALMNELYVNIKVDREERPDIDQVYQNALQLLTGQAGGWPLTMFLAPATRLPFFGGTYFPDKARQDTPAFTDLLQRVHAYYRDHQQEIVSQSDAVREALAAFDPTPPESNVQLDRAPLDTAKRELAAAFDQDYGGFGGAPKFPHAASLERLLRTWRSSASSDAPDVESLLMATLTLKRMALGGVYDQLAGGFFRYSTDPYWMIPHFEKMLYDNGPLLALYAQAWQATGEGLFRRIAVEIAGWVMDNMQSPEGGYYSSLDADSGGEEGSHYVFAQGQAEAVLTADEYRAIAARFGLDRPANFEGRWHLHVFADDAELNQAVALDAPAVAELLESGRTRLLALRQRRALPARDEKQLTGWNALMIRGMAAAALALNDAAMALSAERALEFVQRDLWHNNRLFAASTSGRTQFAAYLDDYVFLIDALLTMLQLRWRNSDLALCEQLAEVLLEQFEDQQAGGFYFTANDQESLIHRTRQLADGAVPSGNGVAALVLNRLGALLGRPRYIEAAQRTLRLAWAAIGHNASAHSTLLNALEEVLRPPEIVVIRGEPVTIAAWRETAAQVYAPARLVFAVPSDAAGLPPAIEMRQPRGKAVAYICQGTTCSAPLTSLQDFASALSEQ